ncbi:hypothetical protein ASG39_15535 [Rhizobium sp. Leaf371]|uniref:hypothetical protein n=1 Tax=Rhizobium sp. Leaf371 TaxID=1736355 RepID=UPI00071326C8|nr:hypothetical protein [Rhizobium sp. Leaf371]KQS63304.1 hypothetical protein ASG39_15535 [Rhizobium sp. Leaf371]
MTTSSELAAPSGTSAPDLGPSGRRILLRAGLAIGLLAALTVAICIGGPKIGATLALGGNTTSTDNTDIVIGTDHLRLPAHYIRFADQRQTGAAERVDLYATWPEMQGYSDATRGRFNDVTRTDGLIFLQISQSTMSRDMSGRIAPIYSHVFEGAPTDGPAGLTGHRMTATSGYGAEIFFTAPSGTTGGPDAYGVRCLMPERPELATSADCQRDVHAGQDLVVLYRFSSQLLPQWHAIDEAVLRFVEAKLVP